MTFSDKITKIYNLASKSVFVIKLACDNVALKTSETNLLNSEVLQDH